MKPVCSRLMRQRKSRGSNNQQSSRPSRQFKKQPQRKFKPKMDSVKKTTEEEMNSSLSSDNEFIDHAVNHLSQMRKVQSISNISKTVSLSMNDVDVRVEPNSGANVNIMDEHQFKALINRSVEKPMLEFSKIKLSTLQNNLPVKGEFITTLRNKTRGTLAEVVVIKGKINSPPLISKTILIELGMLQICYKSLGRPNNMRIQNSASNENVMTRGIARVRIIMTARPRGEET